MNECCLLVCLGLLLLKNFIIINELSFKIYECWQLYAKLDSKFVDMILDYDNKLPVCSKTKYRLGM
jgi:hypothetical protein